MPPDTLDPLPTDNMVTSGLTEVIVPPAPAVESAEPGISIVNLKHVVGINGTNYGPGEGIHVPTDAFALWGPAQATE